MVNDSFEIHVLRGLSSAQILILVGARAKARRLALGRSQEDVARAAALSRSTVARFEMGRSVEIDAAIRIAIALGAEDGFGALFPRPQAQTIDDILGARRNVRKRAPRARRRAGPAT